MASSQAKPAGSDVESSLRLVRNPLRLRKQKDPIVGARGHVFNAQLTCGHCGKEWSEQRVEPSGCGDSEEVEAAPT